MAPRYKPGEFNEARKRMARIPKGARLIRNSVSVAPGFQIENVFVMAGVPMIMRAMLEDLAPRLRRGAPVHTCTISVRVAEGRIATALAEIQRVNPAVAIGSYPFYGEDGSGVQLVVRGSDAAAVALAADSIESAAKAQGIEPKRENG